MIRGNSYEKGLAAAFLGQKDFTGRQIRMHRYGMRSLKVVDCQPEGFVDSMVLAKILVDDKWNDFGVGGDILVDSTSA